MHDAVKRDIADDRLPVERERQSAGPLAGLRLSGVASFRSFLIWFLGALVLSFSSVWIYVALCPMAFMNRDYPLWIAKRTMIEQCRPNTVAVFGDSRAVAGILPRAMPFPVINLALSGSSTVETYFSVRRLLSCPNPPRMVVIAHSAVKYLSDGDFWIFSARTGFLETQQIAQVERDARRLNDRELDQAAAGSSLPPWVRDPLFGLHFPSFYFASLINGYVGGRYFHNQFSVQQALLSRGQALFGRDPGTDAVADEAQSTLFEPGPLADLYFTKALELLSRRNIPVVIVTMPLNQATFNRTPSSLQAGFTAYMQAKTRGVHDLRLFDPTIACWPDEYFGDAWHFNMRGAETFSRELGIRLQHVLAGEPAPRMTGRCAQGSMALPARKTH